MSAPSTPQSFAEHLSRLALALGSTLLVFTFGLMAVAAAQDRGDTAAGNVWFDRRVLIFVVLAIVFSAASALQWMRIRRGRRVDQG